MLRRLGLSLLLGAGMCGMANAQGPTPFDGQYVGELTLLKVIGGDCTEPPLGARYPLSITAGLVEFKYVPRFDTKLRGRVDPKGNFKAVARVKRGVVEMTGHIEPNHAMTATIVSPSCRYAFNSGH